jgi:hypothetical protein
MPSMQVTSKLRWEFYVLVSEDEAHPRPPPPPEITPERAPRINFEDGMESGGRAPLGEDPFTEIP